MIKSFFIFIIAMLISSYSFSQEKYDWMDVLKIELFSFSKTDFCENIKSTDLTSNIAQECDKDEYQKHLLQLKEPELDVIMEKECLILRVYFSSSNSNFVIYRDQGVLANLNDTTIMFKIKNVDEFDKLINQSIN